VLETNVEGSVSKPNRNVAVQPWATAIGSYQDGAVEVVAEGIKVHWAKLRIPDKTYEADYAWVKVRHGAVSVFFGKQDLDSPNTLRTRLEIRYPVEKFLNHFWRQSRDFHQKLREARKYPGWSANRIKESPETMKALKDHSETANFDYCARSGSEAVIDFYYVSPSGIARLAQGMGATSIRVDPVVRIQLMMPELLGLLDAAEPVVEELTKNLPEEYRDDADPVP
jgi:hypothetical protein